MAQLVESAAASIIDVYINCPFDAEYLDFLDASCFTLQICGFRPRCALEVVDSSTARIHRISKLIEECHVGIHDISRYETEGSGLPRFNMPFELGMYLGAKTFGGQSHSNKSCLVMDSDKHRYRTVLSDISGQDIESHSGQIAALIVCVRNYLSGFRTSILPGDLEILTRYNEFRTAFPDLCQSFGLTVDNVHFRDRLNIIYYWLRNQQLRESKSRNTE